VRIALIPGKSRSAAGLMKNSGSMMLIAFQIESLSMTLPSVAPRKDDDVGAGSQITNASSDDYHRESSCPHF